MPLRPLLATTLLLVLAACIQLGPASPPFPTQSQSHATHAPGFEGLDLRGTVAGSGSHLDLWANATNSGPATYKVSAICAPPWSDELAGPHGPIHRTEPRAYCAAFGLKPFPPGSRDAFHARWNGTRWDPDRGATVPADPGTYTWTVRFEAYKGGNESYEYDDHTTLSLPFQVTH